MFADINPTRRDSRVAERMPLPAGLIFASMRADDPPLISRHFRRRRRW